MMRAAGSLVAHHREAQLSEAILLSWYRELPEWNLSDDPDLSGASRERAMQVFQRRVRERYSEGTLQRLLRHPSTQTRLAAITGLASVGTMASNAELAAILQGSDVNLAGAAESALWEVWFRGGSAAQVQALRRLARLDDLDQALIGLSRLVREATEYAEAFNQRAIVFFRRGEFLRAVQDCEVVLRLNPHHFGAQAGMGHCFLKLHRPRAALRAFRLALDIYPTAPGIAETVRSLEEELARDESRGDYLDG